MRAQAVPALRMAFWDYDRARPFIEGAVNAAGRDLAIEVHRLETTFRRALSRAEFDVCEISFSNSITALSKG
jgi:4,5-dihydroxyphthalate decarboxylase